MKAIKGFFIRNSPLFKAIRTFLQVALACLTDELVIVLSGTVLPVEMQAAIIVVATTLYTAIMAEIGSYLKRVDPKEPRVGKEGTE